MNTIDLAIKGSLAEMKNSLSLDMQMLRNYRGVLVKSQQFDRLEQLKAVEQQVADLLTAIDAAML